MVEMTKPEIVAALTARGNPMDRAVMYADAFLEYRDASANIDKNGAVVSHPRTANPIVNPCLAIRDRALAKLGKMRVSGADALWKTPDPVPPPA
jgi:hypothetical protein